MAKLSISTIHALLSGQRRGPAAAAARGLLRAAEPFYSSVVRGRNYLYDTGFLASHRLPVPVVSIGNITAGGTGKTPFVRWLAGCLREDGMRPAILLRGYARGRTGLSDEEELLRAYLDRGEGRVPVAASPDRVAAARALLVEHPEINIFLLDDGFQHRRLCRDFDLVLIDATNPFGYGHVHPRGLLREPLAALRRADAFALTRCDLVAPAEREAIEQTLRIRAPAAPVYRCRHALAGLRSAQTPPAWPPDLPLDTLGNRPFFAFAGIANPAALHRQLGEFSAPYRGYHWFDDHHDYRDADLARLRELALAAGAELLITTEKDWTKLRQLPPATAGLPICRLELALQFEPPGEDGLLSLIRARIDRT